MSTSILNILLFGGYSLSRAILVEDEDKCRPEDGMDSETMFHYWYDVYFEAKSGDDAIGVQAIQLTISAECWNTYLASRWDYPEVEIVRQRINETVIGTTPETILSNAAPLGGGPRSEPLPTRFQG